MTVSSRLKKDVDCVNIHFFVPIKNLSQNNPLFTRGETIGIIRIRLL